MKLSILLLALMVPQIILAKPLTCNGADYDTYSPLIVVVDSDPATSLSKFAIYEADEDGTIGELYGKGQLSDMLQPGGSGSGTITFPDGQKSDFKTLRGVNGFDSGFLFSDINGTKRNLWFYCFSSWED